MQHSFITKEHLGASITFGQYVERAEAKVAEANRNSPEDSESKSMQYIALNYHRMRRILNNYVLPPELQSKLRRITSSHIWLVLTEDWCGDSAQSLSYIAKMAEVNPLIELKILYRDEHPELMDRYLTDGKRSIPKLIAIDESGNELFRWGPRPKEAAAIFNDSLASGISKDEAYERLHLWYPRNRGRAIEAELDALISQVANVDEAVSS